MRKKLKTLSGAASFYIVAFSTLILVIIATSFATVILSEVARSMNDDLSQSAYDSALAGVEDAKLAYANYQRCVESGALAKEPNNDGQVSCGEIIYWMNHPDCDMVGHILGRLPEKKDADGNEIGGEVPVSDTVSTSGGDVENNLNQAYTCVQIKTQVDDYRATLSSNTPVRVMKAEFEHVEAKEIESVKLSWYSVRSGEKFVYNDFLLSGSGAPRVAFQPTGSVSITAPPTMEFAFVQTDKNFSFDDVIAASNGANTDRGTLYLVPTGENEMAKKKASINVLNENTTYIGVAGDGRQDSNHITAEQVAKTNNRQIRNLPFVVYCPENNRNTGNFACSVTIDLPLPYKGGNRNDDTFMFVTTLPYAQPETDFSLEFVCKSIPCTPKEGVNQDMMTEQEKNKGIASLKGTQVLIDSTGRANDLYRRIEVRLEAADVTFPYTYYALELLGNGDESVMRKDMTVTSEWNDYR